jgi:hypothetical protein
MLSRVAEPPLTPFGQGGKATAETEPKTPTPQGSATIDGNNLSFDKDSEGQSHLR